MRHLFRWLLRRIFLRPNDRYTYFNINAPTGIWEHRRKRDTK